jgi:hypothetical protein
MYGVAGGGEGVGDASEDVTKSPESLPGETEDADEFWLALLS